MSCGQPLLVVARHVGQDVDAALGLEVAVLVEAPHQVVLLLDGLEIDHGQVAALAENVPSSSST